jgi:hypothetical protein
VNRNLKISVATFLSIIYFFFITNAVINHAVVNPVVDNSGHSTFYFSEVANPIFSHVSEVNTSFCTPNYNTNSPSIYSIAGIVAVIQFVENKIFREFIDYQSYFSNMLLQIRKIVLLFPFHFHW